MKDRNKRKLIIYGLLGVLMLTTVAYASLQTILNVSGTVVKKGNLWNIYFTNPSSASVVGTATGGSLNIQASKLDFSVSLYKPGDKVTYTVDIKNGGTIDAVLNSISLTGLDTASNNNINYTVTYSDGSTIKEGDALNVGANKTLKITVEFDSNATSLPASDVNLTFGVTLIYGQTTGSSSTGTSGITSNNVIAGIYGESIQNGTPTPTSPVEIESVGEKTKNLLDASTGTIRGWNIEGIECNLKAGATYTFTNFNSDVAVALLDEGSDTNLSGYLVKGASKTFTLATNVTKLLLGYGSGDEQPNAELHQLFLQEGSTTTSYEPYGYKIPIIVSNGTETKTTNIYLKEPLRKIGEYADYLDLTNKKVVRNVKEIKILTVNKNDTQTNSYKYFNRVNGLKTGIVLSNYFKYNENLSNEFGALGNKYGVIYLSGKNIVEKDNSELSDASLMNAWLTEKSNSGNPVLVDYILETSTEESVNIPEIPSLTGNVTYSIDASIKPSKIEYGY